MADTAQIPAWVVPTPRAVADCHWIAHNVAAEVGRASVHGEVCSILDWVTSALPTDTQVRTRLTEGGAAGATVAWLLGYAKPPIDLPRRNPDGTLLTVAQFVAEFMAGKWNGPEERRDADRWARREAARNQELASLVPH
jgi:hypothetical protein